MDPIKGEMMISRKTYKGGAFERLDGRYKMFLVCATFCAVLGGCPKSDESVGGPQQSQQTQQAPQGRYPVVVTQETAKDVPCSIDLSSVQTQERMERLEPELQKLMVTIERKFCRFYEQLWLVDRFDDKSMGDFPGEHFPDEYLTIRKNEVKYRPFKKFIAADISDTVYLILKSRHPDSNCAEETKKMFLASLEGCDHYDSDRHVRSWQNDPRRYCEHCFGSNIVEGTFLIFASHYLGLFPGCGKHQNEL